MRDARQCGCKQRTCSQELDTAEIAQRLRVSRNSVNVWRRSWKIGGTRALVSKGASGSACRLSDDQLARLGAELNRGPAAHGWTEDQRWTLARVALLITKLFRIPLHPARRVISAAPNGIQPTDAQTPGGRPRRDQDRRVAAGDLGKGKTLAAEQGAWLCFEDEAGHTLRPARARTWSRRG